MKYPALIQEQVCYFCLLATLLTACSQTEMSEPKNGMNHAIGFNTYTGVQTRGTETTQASLKASGFGITAYLTRGEYSATAERTPYMDNQQVTWNANQWTYSPGKYWPNNGTDRLSFFAYAPYDNGTHISMQDTPGAAPMLNFTLQDDQKQQADLVVSSVTNQSGTDVPNQKVTFNFKHALSKVKMMAKPGSDLAGNSQVEIYLTGVKLKHSGKLAKQATFDFSTSTWTPTAYIDDTYDLGDPTNGSLNLPDGLPDGTQALNLSNAFTDGLSLFADEQALYLIPINGATGCDAGDVTAEISYCIVTYTDDGKTGTPYVSSITKDVDLQAGGFKQGAIHTYTFTLGMNEVTVSADTDIYIPLGGIDNFNMVIRTPEDLVRFRNIINTENPNFRGLQVADIDMSQLTTEDATNWTPIKDFAGIYDGQNYTISNLISSPTAGDAGLFASTTASSILTRIRIKNAKITGVYKSKAGVLASQTAGTVSYCSVESSKILGKGANSGGLIGHVTATSNVAFCSANTAITMTFNGENTGFDAGGCVGLNDGTIASCSANGGVDSNSREARQSGYVNFGGFVGRNQANIYGSYATGNVRSAGYYVAVGGFAGNSLVASSIIIGCYSKGNVYNSGSDNTLAASFCCGKTIRGTFINNFCTGSFTNKYEKGGFFCVVSSVTCTNCYTSLSTAVNGGTFSGVTINSNANQIRSVMRTPHSSLTIKIATGGSLTTVPTVKEVTWNPETFWSETAGTDAAPDINWDVPIN